MMQVDFIFGLGSRYSYLAATRLQSLAARCEVRFRWHPIHSPMLFEARRNNPFTGGSEGQYDWDYRRRDAEAWARLYGVPFRDPVERLSYPARTVALAARAAGRQDALEVMSVRLFRLIFVDDRTMFGHGEIVAEADDLGLDRQQFEADLAAPGLEAEHDSDVARFARQGVFGVPTFVLEDGRSFWGNDRLVLLEAALEGRI